MHFLLLEVNGTIRRGPVDTGFSNINGPTLRGRMCFFNRRIQGHCQILQESGKGKVWTENRQVGDTIESVARYSQT